MINFSSEIFFVSRQRKFRKFCAILSSENSVFGVAGSEGRRRKLKKKCGFIKKNGIFYLMITNFV